MASKAGSNPWDYPFCREEQYYPPASAVVIGLKHRRTMMVPRGVTWNEYLSSWQHGGRQLMAYQNLTGNADSERLKTTIRLNQYLWIVNSRRGWNVILCAGPDVQQGISSSTSTRTPYMYFKTYPTFLEGKPCLNTTQRQKQNPKQRFYIFFLYVMFSS